MARTDHDHSTRYRRPVRPSRGDGGGCRRAARRRLSQLIEQVTDDQEPVEIVSRPGSAYLVSADQWRSLMETAHLLRSPANAERVLRSIAAADAGHRTVTRPEGDDATG
jgi:antitoxin YefM